MLTAAAAPGSMPARAGPAIDCKAVNRGALNVKLDAATRATRTVTLRSGETLKFTFNAQPGPSGTLTLLAASGPQRVLLAGPTGTSAPFAAARTGVHSFLFAKDGDKAASFTASCRPGRGATPLPPPLRNPAPGGDVGLASGLPQLADPEGLSFKAGLPLPPHANSAPGAADGATPAPKPPGRTEMRLQWRSERYAPAGPEGPEIDGDASGVEIGVNYKLQSAFLIGALAQFDPAGETPFGGQHSLLSDHAWMAGPVATVNFAPGLVLNARAAWGESGLDDLAATGPAAQRRLISARLAKAHSFGAWRFKPSVSFSHFEETLRDPDRVSADAAGSGRIDIAPELAYRIDMAPSAFIEPRAVVGSFWGFESLSKLAPGVGVHLEPRLRAEAGVTLGIVDGPKLQALGAVEEGDGTAPDAWSGRVQFSVPLK
jgi:hypothetical protein